MISLSQVLSGKPILLKDEIYFYQPNLQEITDMGESTYWSLLNLWTLKRSVIIESENDYTSGLDDYEVWKQYVTSNINLKRILSISCQVLLKSKVEFFDISNTIFIGERESGLILDNTFYFLMKELCSRIMLDDEDLEDSSQYKEVENMSERERQMIEKMKSSAKKIEETKNLNKRPEDFLGNRILGLVAIGKYTFEQVYSMTMLQFNMLLKKYVDIQNFEIRSMLSPYISSEDGQENKYWLD